MIKASIVGATGYSGAVLAGILSAHKDVEIISLTSKTYAGKTFSDIYKNFKGILDIELEEQNIEKISKNADVIFVALPHGIASAQIDAGVLSNAKVIDLGADFRLKDKEVYENWYNTKHHGEELLDNAVYGLCEWEREKVKSASLVANPGCYATASILAAAPLLKEGVICPDDIIIDAKSGVSGAGRSLDLGVHYCECSDSIKAYKVASHRHTPEIEQVLSCISGKDPLVNFTPHLVPMKRGILASVYMKPVLDISLNDIRAIYKKYYKNEYFIRFLNEGEVPETRWVQGSNFCDINVFKDPRTKRIIAFSAIDNLVKGAAGQAVQNMNIMFGLEEKTSLENIAMFP